MPRVRALGLVALLLLPSCGNELPFDPDLWKAQESHSGDGDAPRWRMRHSAAQQVWQGMLLEDVKEVLGPPDWVFEDYDPSHPPPDDEYEVELGYHLGSGLFRKLQPFLSVVCLSVENVRRVSRVYIKTKESKGPTHVEID